LKHIKILSNKTDLYCDLLDALKSKVYVNDFIYAETVEQVEGLLKSEPFFSDYYVVVVDLFRFKKEELTKFEGQAKKCVYVQFVVICYNKEQYDKLGWCKLGFNSYRLSEKYYLHYMEKRLTKSVRKLLTGEDYTRIYKKIYGHFEMMDRIILRLNKGEDKQIVIRGTVIDRSLNWDKFWYSLLLGQNQKKVFAFLQEYRYGYSFLHNFLKEKMEECDKFFRDFLEGKLNVASFKQYCAENRLKEYKVAPYLEVVNSMSYQKFMLMKELVYRTKTEQFSVNQLAFSLFYFDEIYAKGDAVHYEMN
jgi:hypothetical protein